MVVVLVAMAAGCSDNEETNGISPTPTIARPTVPLSLSSAGSSTFSVGLTYGNVSGNRNFSGTGQINENTVPIELVSAEFLPRWVLGSLHPRGGSAWSVVGSDGYASGQRITLAGEPATVGGIYNSLHDGLVPPMLLVGAHPAAENDPG